MTWRNTTTEKPANSVDVLGWTGEKYAIGTFHAGFWIVEDEYGEVMHHDADYITHWMELPASPQPDTRTTDARIRGSAS
jgi:hypothetical protein